MRFMRVQQCLFSDCLDTISPDPGERVLRPVRWYNPRHPRFHRRSRIVMTLRCARCCSCQRLEVRRLLAAGEIDVNFGNQGSTAIASIVGQWNDVASAPGGAIVAVGQTNHKGPTDLIAARFDTNGKLDTTFGANGLALFDFGGKDAGQHVMVRSDGRIVIGGKINGAPGTIRLKSDGSLDPTFGKQGIVPNFAAQLAQSDGDLIGVADTSIQRRSPRGVLDTTIGTNGSVNVM